MKKLIIILVLVAAAQAATMFFGFNNSGSSGCELDKATVEDGGFDPACTPLAGLDGAFTMFQDRLTFTPSTLQVTKAAWQSTKYSGGNADGVQATVKLASGDGAWFKYNCPDCDPPGTRNLCLCRPGARLNPNSFRLCNNTPLKPDGTCKTSSVNIILQATEGTIAFQAVTATATTLKLE